LRSSYRRLVAGLVDQFAHRTKRSAARAVRLKSNEASPQTYEVYRHSMSGG
jgi:hypothetical protein